MSDNQLQQELRVDRCDDRAVAGGAHPKTKAIRRVVVVVLLFLTMLAAGLIWLGGDRPTPESSAATRCTKLHRSVVTVPFRGPGHAPLFDVFVNGSGPFKFLLDTGSSGTHISTRLAGELKLARTGRKVNFRNAAGESVDSQVVRLGSLRLGDAEFVRFEALARPFRAGLDGIVGYDRLREVLVTLDFPNRRLIIQDGSLPLADGREVLPVEGDVPQLWVWFGGERVKLLIDSGSNGAFMLPEAAAAKLRLLDSRAAAWMSIAGSQDCLRCQVTRFDGNVQIGGHVVEKPVVEVIPSGAAVVGTKVLKHFEVTFDAANARVRLARQGDGPIHIPGSWTFGLLFGVRGSTVTIADLDRTLAPEKVMIGDRVVTVNDHPVGEIDLQAVMDQHETVKLELMRNGRRFSVDVSASIVP